MHKMAETPDSSAPVRCLPSQTILFTDIDGTFISATHFNAGPAIDCAKALQAQGLHLVIASSKTEAEISDLLGQWKLSAGYIAENGNVMVTHAGRQVFGQDFAYLAETFRRYQPNNIQALNDLPLSQQSKILGLEGAELQRAMNRQYSLLFVGEEGFDLTEFNLNMAKHGLQATQGGRVFSLARIGTSKAKAMQAYANTLPNLTRVALGDAPNDLEMLQAADISAIVHNPKAKNVMQASGFIPTYHTMLEAPEGWVEAVKALVKTR